jgi:predicted Fe-Mo cluster-binding NifX family protein
VYKKMKICVTATAGDLNAQIDPRFGRSQYFVIVDSDTMTFEALPNEAMNAPGGAGIQAAQAMVNKGVDAVISGNLGPNAFQVLSTAGVKIATGAYGTVKEAVEMYKSGKLNETRTSTVAAHTGIGAGVAPGMGRGRGGGGRGMQQSMQPQQPPQQMPAEPEQKEGEVEQLSEIVETLEKNLGEVKKRIAELKKR